MIDTDRFSHPMHWEEIDYTDEYREQDEEFLNESWDKFDLVINTY